MANPKTNQATTSQFAHISVEVKLVSAVAIEYTRRSTGFVMGALTNFYKLISDSKDKRSREVLEEWLDRKMEDARSELNSVKSRVDVVKEQHGSSTFKQLTYPRPSSVTITCSHPASYAIVEMLKQFDEIAKVADGLWMTRSIHRKQREQINNEARATISRLIDSINKFITHSRGRKQESQPVNETTENQEPSTAEVVPGSSNNVVIGKDAVDKPKQKRKAEKKNEIIDSADKKVKATA